MAAASFAQADATSFVAGIAAAIVAPADKNPKGAADAPIWPAPEKAMRAFIETVVHFLDRHRIARGFKVLVVCATRSMLRRLGLTVPPALRGRIVAAVPMITHHRLEGEWWRGHEAARPVPH